MEISEIVKSQRDFFKTGVTKSYIFRRKALQNLQTCIKENIQAINQALYSDFNKCDFEVYMTEVGLVLEEIRFHLKHLRKWLKVKRAPSSLAQFPAASYLMNEPLGCALIISPWNYPILLCLMPLIGAISAGCTAIVKPSIYAPKTSALLASMIESAFPKNYIAVVQGGRHENQMLLEEQFDKIFFTGSSQVGRLVLEKASKNLTPVTLELGGKSPVIVDASCNLRLAARRIAFGKVLNAGQTCVAPDYAFIEQSIYNEFLLEYQKAIESFFSNGDFSTMSVIINEKHFERLSGLLVEGKIVIGGKSDKSRRFIEPTVLVDCREDSSVLSDEIFGPILPIIPFKEVLECIAWINARPKPLALYLFTKKKEVENLVLTSCSFGGGCVNDTVVHLASSHLPFGGVGESGMGHYHGKKSFDTFSHEKSILRQSGIFDVPLRYRPFSKMKQKLLKIFLR